MPTLGAEPTRTEPNRAGPAGGDRGWLIARSRKIRFAKKRSVSSTPNAYFVGFQFLKHSKCVGHSILPHDCSLQRASRLRKTYFFDKLHFPTGVSSTPNAHFENQVSSRLHQMLALKKQWSLVHTKHLLREADPPSGGNEGVHFWWTNWKCIL